MRSRSKQSNLLAGKALAFFALIAGALILFAISVAEQQSLATQEQGVETTIEYSF